MLKGKKFDAFALSVVWNVRSVIRNGRSVIWNVRSVIWNGEL